jgi:glycosyltransferase involved in cell wall biosynthesis
MKLSVIMPVFNEEATVKKAVNRVLEKKSVSQLIIIDDASTDNSLKIIQGIKNKKIVVVSHSKNVGKGACIASAVPLLTGDYCIINDADLEYDPNDFDRMLAPIREGKAKVVFGSRFKGSHTNMFFWHYVGNLFLNFLVNILYNTTLSDMESCYKLIPTKMMKAVNLQAKGFEFEPEITCKLLKMGVRIYEVPISYAGRGYEEGKKMHWTQGITACAIILKERFA